MARTRSSRSLADRLVLMASGSPSWVPIFWRGLSEA
jgi:hypothetical protein